MLQRFKDYIAQQHLIGPSDTVLLAVSGGRDSVGLAHLMHRAGIPFAIAHCNFHLRPGECDRDQQFVRDMALSYGVPFHTVDFDTRQYAALHNESIEEAARHLRYGWFASLVARQPVLSCVATAHHADDSVETFFLNLFRGTGIAGLHGIRPSSVLSVQCLVFSDATQSGGSQLNTEHLKLNTEHLTLNTVRLIRPLLCFSRTEIDAYIQENGLAYVEDSTNAELEARRNQLRHRLMPLLRELYPSVLTTMQSNMERLHDTEQVFRAYVDDLRARVIHNYESRLPSLPVAIEAVSVADIQVLSPQRTLLFELLRPYGFNAAVVDDIIQAIGQSDTVSGRMFYSPTHVAELHRGQLLIAPDLLPTANDLPLTANRSPLTTRPWRDGDRFRPKGMKGTRLVSDFLKDLHLSRIERRYVTVAVDADGTIRSVVGLRDAE